MKIRILFIGLLAFLLFVNLGVFLPWVVSSKSPFWLIIISVFINIATSAYIVSVIVRGIFYIKEEYFK